MIILTFWMGLPPKWAGTAVVPCLLAPALPVKELRQLGHGSAHYSVATNPPEYIYVYASHWSMKIHSSHSILSLSLWVSTRYQHCLRKRREGRKKSMKESVTSLIDSGLAIYIILSVVLWRRAGATALPMSPTIEPRYRRCWADHHPTGPYIAESCDASTASKSKTYNIVPSSVTLERLLLVALTGFGVTVGF